MRAWASRSTPSRDGGHCGTPWHAPVLRRRATSPAIWRCAPLRGVAASRERCELRESDCRVSHEILRPNGETATPTAEVSSGARLLRSPVRCCKRRALSRDDARMCCGRWSAEIDALNGVISGSSIATASAMDCISVSSSASIAIAPSQTSPRISEPGPPSPSEV